jgi:hypothetical protein
MAPIDIILPVKDKPMDDLIAQGYQRSSMAQAMITALGDPHLKRWHKALRKELRHLIGLLEVLRLWPRSWCYYVIRFLPFRRLNKAVIKRRERKKRHRE